MGLLNYFKRNTTLYPTAQPYHIKNVPSDYYTTTRYSLLSGTTSYNVNNIPLVEFPAKLLINIQKIAGDNIVNYSLEDLYESYTYNLTGEFAGKIIDPLDNTDECYFLVKYQLTNEQFNNIQLSLEKANLYNNRWRNLPVIQPLEGTRQLAIYDMSSSLPSILTIDSKVFNQSEKAIYLVRSFNNPNDDSWMITKVRFSLIYHLKREGIITIPTDADSLLRFLDSYKGADVLFSGNNLLFPEQYIIGYNRNILFEGIPFPFLTPSVYGVNPGTTNNQGKKETFILSVNNTKCNKKDYKRLFIQLPAGLASRYGVQDYMNNDYLALYVLPEEYSEIEEGEKPRYINTFSNYRMSARVGRVGFNVNAPDLNNDRLRAVIKYLALISYSTTYDKHSPITVIDFCKPEPEDVEIAIRNNSDPYTVRNGVISVSGASGTIGEKSSNYNQGLQFTFMETKLRLLA